MQERRAKGLYWDRAWKLVEGCTKVSAGCDNCWSEAETVMRAGHPNRKIAERASLVTQVGMNCEGFNGAITLREDSLDLPLRVKKPTVWACWNDLYHEDVPDDFRDRAYAVMALCPQHVFLVLTKRARRMAMYWQNKRILQNVVWHGVTAENQQAADERIPHLLLVPGKRFVSVEPLLGPVDLNLIYEHGPTEFGGSWGIWESCLNGMRFDPWSDCSTGGHPAIHAVLLGGESGKNARPMEPQWARSVRGQCVEAGIPFFFKQWGEWRYAKGGMENFSSTPVHRCQNDELVYRVGKRAAGRLLDGKTHNDLPFGQEASK